MTRYRTAVDGDIPALKRIWEKCFGDEPEFIDRYYDMRYEPEQTFVAERDGLPVSMLTALPMEMETDGDSVSMVYIYAVGTEPGHRGEGLITELMRYSESVLKDRGIAAAALVPAEKGLFNFYGGRGYLPAANIKETVFAREALKPGNAKLVPVNGEEYAGLRDGAVSGPGYFRWDKHAVEYALSEAEYFGGGAFYFSTADAEGAALCVPDGRSLLVKELVMAEPEKDAMTAAAGQLLFSFGAEKVSVRTNEAAPLEGDVRGFLMYKPIADGFAVPDGAYFNLALD